MADTRSLYHFIFRDSFAGKDYPWYIDAASGRCWTGGQVKFRVDALAAALQQEYILGLNVLPSHSRTPLGYLHEVVGLISPNDIDFSTVVWASHKLGAAVAPSNVGSTVEELVHQFKLTEPTLLVAHPVALEKVREAAKQIGLPQDRIIILHRTGDSENTPSAAYQTIDDLIVLGRSITGVVQHMPREHNIAFLCFSSGTTGLPKAVVLSHQAVIANVLQVQASAIPGSRAVPGDKALGVVPFSHMYGLLHLVHLCPYLNIATIVFASMPSFDKFLDQVQSWQINHLFLAPPLVHAFLKHPASKGRSFPHFKSGMVAAAPLSAESEEAFRLMCGPEFLFSQVFGMTETAGLSTALPPECAPRPGSVGCAISHTDIKIVLPDGTPLQDGAVGRGEMYIRGPQLCRGYLNNESATTDAFDYEGYLRTGDEVELSSEGFITVMDRLKHIIKCKGFQVSPAELEGHILQSPLVEDVGVVGRTDERAGEVPVAFIVPTEEGKALGLASVDELKSAIKKHVADHKSSYKWLADVYILSKIPKLPSGKILLRELRKLLNSSHEELIPPPGIDFQLARQLVKVEAGSTISSPSSPQTPKVQEHALTSNQQCQHTVVLRESEDEKGISEPKSIQPYRGLALLAREKRADPAPSVATRAREWISWYRLFHLALLSLNAVGIGFTLAHRWHTGLQFSATFASCNILASLLARNEVFVRLLFQSVMLLFKRWPPLFFRNAVATFLLNIGGLHSGFAVSGTLWLITATIEFFRSGPSLIHPAILALSVFASVVLLAVCGSAYPTLRNTHHNVFENLHRLVGWSGLAILWILVGLADSWSVQRQQFSHNELLHKPDLYLIIVLTCLIVLPWTTVRKVPVQTRVLSKSVCQIRFVNGGGYGVGFFGRIARHPLKENHAFGITSFGPKSKDYYMIIVGQGDFTRGLIENPPTHVYTRMYKFVGLPYIVNMYRRGLYVVTGSAIGVALSVFLQPDAKSDWHLLWVAGNIEKTYADTAIRDLQAALGDDVSHRITIWDSRIKGRPNLIQLIEERVRSMAAEVVFVTSNPKGTADVLRACRERSIPAHGPVWDS